MNALKNVLTKYKKQTNGINYLQRQLPALNKEIKTKDKIIDYMAECIFEVTDYEEEKIFNYESKQEVKDYFRGKVLKDDR